MPERRTSSSPKPWRQFEARTTFLRVPASDWPAVKRGGKTEFRLQSGRGVTQLWNVTCPALVVGWSLRARRHDSSLLVLEEHFSEPLGAISEESLRREGFASTAEFRAYWIQRTRHRFRPLDTVYAFRVRPLVDGDLDALGRALIERLYREHIR